MSSLVQCPTAMTSRWSAELREPLVAEMQLDPAEGLQLHCLQQERWGLICVTH
jgi:hypothetical protein